jgi:hypothetical protein
MMNKYILLILSLLVVTDALAMKRRCEDNTEANTKYNRPITQKENGRSLSLGGD